MGFSLQKNHKLHIQDCFRSGFRKSCRPSEIPAAQVRYAQNTRKEKRHSSDKGRQTSGDAGCRVSACIARQVRFRGEIRNSWKALKTKGGELASGPDDRDACEREWPGIEGRNAEGRGWAPRQDTSGSGPHRRPSAFRPTARYIRRSLCSVTARFK